MKKEIKGFTLIELLVVVLIIGILAAVAVPQYQKAIDKARATEAVTNLKALVQAEETYFLTNGTYTDTIGNLDVSIPAGQTYSFRCNTTYCQAWPKNSDYRKPVFQFNFANRLEDERILNTKLLTMCIALNKNKIADSTCKSMTKKEPIDCSVHCYYSIDL